jgi:hypothetical protein
MKRTLLFAAMLAAFLQTTAVANADVATDWNRTFISAIETANTAPPPAMRAGAIVQASVFDALNGIEGRYTPIHVQPGAPPGASRAAAVAGAAYEALVALFPSQKSAFDLQLQASLAQITDNPGNQSVTRGLAWRATDGFTAALPAYVPSGLPGRWAPTAPAFAPPVFRQFATMTPWAMSSPSQFRPAPPPSLTSTRYAQDLNEVATMGRDTSAARNAWQTQTAVLWNSDTPVVIFDRVADGLIDASDLPLTQSVRLLARMNVAMGDAVISIYDGKNFYDRWRPITAIRLTDPSWTPLITTPAHQEYPSGHSGVSSAGAGVLAAEFGDQTSFNVTAFPLPGVVRSFTSFSDAVAQVGDARVWAGIHFRYACDAAIQEGAQIAAWVNDNVAVPIHGPNR